MRHPYIRPFVSACVLAAAWTAATPAAHAQTTLTSGNATFTLTETPTAENSVSYRADFKPEGGATVDHLFSQWMFYRVGADTRTRPFGTYTKSGGGDVTLSGSASGTTMTYTFTDKDSGGVTRFIATWTLTLQDGPTAGTATVLHSLQVDNPTASPLTLSLIHFLDYDLADSPTGHSATGGPTGMTITNGLATGTSTPVTAVSHFQAAETGTIDTGFVNGETTGLNDTGLPFPSSGGAGDWTGAYQWDLTIPAGGSATIQFEMGVSPVPEPTAVLALAAVGLGLLGKARRARLTPRG